MLFYDVETMFIRIIKGNLFHFHFSITSLFFFCCNVEKKYIDIINVRTNIIAYFLGTNVIKIGKKNYTRDYEMKTNMNDDSEKNYC